MKTKTVTKQRHAEREYELAVIDCKNEYGSIISDDFLEEVYVDEEDD